ncbi:MAG TPA: CBS domain-containing protein [Myxococcota bacterium]|nr:CBS domain-containing protein [Myxococcota bacterium]
MADRVRDIMETKLVTISANERLSTVDDIMTLGRVRHIPVVQAGRLVGVVSQRDLLRASLSAFSEHRDAERRAFLSVVEIARVMSTPPIVVSPEATIEQAAAIMASKRIGCLPVLADDELVGMITETDILRWVARSASRA